MSGRPIHRNAHCRVCRGARYKVYARTITTQLSPHRRWLTRADVHFTFSADGEHAHLGVRARRVAERRRSRHRCRIDHCEALLEWRRAREERGQAAGWPCCRRALDRLPPGCKTRDRLLLARLLGRSDSDATLTVAGRRSCCLPLSRSRWMRAKCASRRLPPDECGARERDHGKRSSCRTP